MNSGSVATRKPNLLAVSFAYPPLAYPRSIQVSRLLNNIQFETTLICADDPSARMDPTIGPHTNGNLRLVHVPVRASARTRLQNRIAFRLSPRLWNRWNRTPDQYGGWKTAVLRAVEGLSFDDSNRPRVLVTFSHPLVDHVIGIELKRRLKLPWIAHFSDPWTDSPFLHLDSYTLARNLELERKTIEGADRLVFTSQETVDKVMSKYPESLRAKTRVLPQCYDESLFAQPPHQQGSVIVRHVGNFYGNRTPEPLFKALAATLTMHPGHLQDVRFELIGAHENIKESAMLQELPAGLVSVKPVVDYQESLNLMSSADGLLVIDAPAEISMFLPSKLIDYIGAGRPIMGFTPTGAAASVIRALGGWITDPQPSDSTVEVFCEFLSYLKNSKTAHEPWGDSSVRTRYSVRRIAAEFESIVAELG